MDDASHIGFDLIGKTSAFETGDPHSDVYPHEGYFKDNVCKNGGLGLNDGTTTAFYADGCKDVVWDGNLAFNYTGPGFAHHAEENAFTTDRVISRYNVAYNCFRNHFVGSAAASNSTDHQVVVHNTFHQSGSRNRNIAQFRKGDNLVINNISLVDNSVDTWHLEDPSPRLGSINIDYNCYWQDGGTPARRWGNTGSFYNTLASWQTTGHDPNSLIANPVFTDSAAHDYTLQTSSPCRDAGRALAFTTTAGAGTVVPISYTYPFTYGWGVIDETGTDVGGDLVMIGTNAPAMVTAVDHSAGTITVNRSISWLVGQDVTYRYAGSAPDMGAKIFGNLPEEPGGAGASSPVVTVPGSALEVSLNTATALTGTSASDTDDDIESVTFTSSGNVAIRLGSLGAIPAGTTLNV